MTDLDKTASDLKTLLAKLVRQKLPRDEMEVAFTVLLSGDASPEQIAGFICALAARGESVDDVVAGVNVLLSHAKTVSAPQEAMDIVGTGGDGVGTWNISTAAALTVAGAGFPVAKHGNVAVSSKSGAAEVLSQLGVNLNTDLVNVQAALDEAGICFLMAPRHHQVMRHVGPVRAALGFRSIFNMMGPLSNPALVKRYMVGVYSPDLITPYGEMLQGLGATHAMVVHGNDGLDEVTTTGPTTAIRLHNGQLEKMTLHPSDIGLETAKTQDLIGGTPEENAAAMRVILNGAKNAYRDIVLFNAAVALFGAGHANDLTSAAAMAASSLDQGLALAKLDQLVAITNRGE